ncbi:MAG: glycosyltransferase family 2 protein [Sandaracinaceae bacterium]|nr:glycosyltransferase family 2 protein [Sandaracinaceae bacterium]
MQALVIGIYLLTLSILAVYGFHRGQLVYLYWKHRKRAPQPKARFAELPVVTVQLPMFNELYVAERLIESVAALDYPKDKLEIQVLDDSTDETIEIARAKVEELVERGYDAVYVHRTDRTGYKAGALEAGLKVSRGDYLLVFDADFVPTPTLILDLVHHFTDEKVGMVQARWGHLNRDYSMLTRVQAMMLDGHFVVEHIARNRSGRFFNFNGTAGMWRKSTIIDAGGWQHDTLTEDMDLSFRAQLRGWRFVYVPDALAPAEVPCEMNSFKTQQFRWAKGSAQTAKKLLPIVLRAKLPLHVKLEALFHLTNNFAYVFLIVLAVLQLPNMVLRQGMRRARAAPAGRAALRRDQRLDRALLPDHPPRPLQRRLGGDPQAAAHDGPRHRPLAEQRAGGGGGPLRRAERVRAHAQARRDAHRGELDEEEVQGRQELLRAARVPLRPLLRGHHRAGRMDRRLGEHPLPPPLHGRLPLRRRPEPLPGALIRSRRCASSRSAGGSPARWTRCGSRRRSPTSTTR